MNLLLLNILRNSTGSTPPPAPEPASFYHDTITVTDGNANAFIYQPEDIDNPPAGGWPLIIAFQGDGTSGNTTRTFSSVAMSTGDNLTYTHSPSAALYRIMCSSIVIKVNGTAVAWGKPGGDIIGTGVTGTITNFDRDEANQNTSPTVSVTFSSSQSGNTITYDYVDSTMLAEGSPRWINLGDTLDNRAVYIAIQNIGNTVDFERDYYDNTVTYAWNNFTINPKRIHSAGISRGGRQIIDQFSNGANTSVLKTRYQYWIEESNGAIYTSAGAGRVEAGVASFVVGTASYGGSFTAANYTDIGMAIVHGTSDGTLTNNTPSFSATMGSNNEPPYIINVLGGFHNYDVWDGKCYKRLYRIGPTVGSITTADWDWVDFLLKYSKDALECATLFVEQVEKRRFNTEKDIIDYRQALRKVSALSASAEKTALEGRLATVKSAIDSTGTRWVLNFHSSGQAAGGNYRDIATDANATTTSNIADFDGNSSGLDFVESTSPNGGGMAVVGSSRRSFTGGFSLTANQSGMTLSGFPIGTFNFGDIPSGTYTVRVYVNNGIANFDTSQMAAVTINSVEKQLYAGISSMLGYIEFTGVAHTHLSSNFTVYCYSGAPKMTMIELYKHP